MIKKRSLVIKGHATSISLEPEFWEIIDLICNEKNCSLSSFISAIEKEKQIKNLASTLRVICLNYLKNLQIEK